MHGPHKGPCIYRYFNLHLPCGYKLWDYPASVHLHSVLEATLC